MKKKNLLLICIVAIILVFSLNVNAAIQEYTCTEVIPTTDGSLMAKLDMYLYKPLKVVTPIALLVLTAFDFSGVVFSGTKEGMNKAKQKFMKRTLAALIIFFAPDIIKLIVSFINQQSIASCLENNFK